MDNNVAIIQARMGSTRLPGKVLMKLGDKTVLQVVVERVKMAKLVDNVIIATTVNRLDDDIIKFCIENNIMYYRGREDDVLQRFKMAAREFDADVIIRITADCPFIDPVIIDDVIRAYNHAPYCDYASNIHPPTFPDGFDVEVFSLGALLLAESRARKKSEREHVTPYIWGHPEMFNSFNIRNDTDLSKIRLTIDTADDYKVISTIYDAFHGVGLSMESILAYLKDNPSVMKINENAVRNEGYAKSIAEDNK